MQSLTGIAVICSDQLNRFSAEGFSATPEELVQTGAYPPYALMYHGRDDRPLREAYARLYKPCFPEPAEPLPATGQRRIGFVVTKAHETIFTRSMAGVLRHMDSKMFELVVICMDGREQLLNEQLACPGVKIMPVPESITGIVQALGQVRFDILYYWEIATDPLNYFLPFYRLAPVQCTSWGIQVTSGIPTVDYYLSSSLVEPQDGAAHYTERLLCSDTLLTYQYRSVLPETPRQRQDFGFGDDVNLYLFPAADWQVSPGSGCASRRYITQGLAWKAGYTAGSLAAFFRTAACTINAQCAGRI